MLPLVGSAAHRHHYFVYTGLAGRTFWNQRACGGHFDAGRIRYFVMICIVAVLMAVMLDPLGRLDTKDP